MKRYKIFRNFYTEIGINSFKPHKFDLSKLNMGSFYCSETIEGVFDVFSTYPFTIYEIEAFDVANNECTSFNFIKKVSLNEIMESLDNQHNIWRLYQQTKNLNLFNREIIKDKISDSSVALKWVKEESLSVEYYKLSKQQDKLKWIKENCLDEINHMKQFISSPLDALEWVTQINVEDAEYMRQFIVNSESATEWILEVNQDLELLKYIDNSANAMRLMYRIPSIWEQLVHLINNSQHAYIVAYNIPESRDILKHLISDSQYAAWWIMYLKTDIDMMLPKVIDKFWLNYMSKQGF